MTCIAFSGPRGSDLWTNTGLSDWHQRHECCSEQWHARAAEIAMQQWRRGCTVSHMIAAGNRNAFIEDNRKVMERVRFLTVQMLAFWGK